MQRVLSADDFPRYAEARRALPPEPDRQDDLAFFTGLWAILPVALGGWALMVWVALQLLG